MTKQYLLGIDIGTSACKVALFGKDGKVEAAVSEGYPVYYHTRAGQNRIRMNGGRLCARLSGQ